MIPQQYFYQLVVLGLLWLSLNFSQFVGGQSGQNT